ncbi:hypothetical protein V8G54_011778 [Vigna mungo]|uniref:Uncharacterized protein n=1 Tax=Vigna mungo TaxID=3915 RepID=A0AAQ3NSX1_VIGMU
MSENIDLNGDSERKQDSKRKSKDESAKTIPLYKLFSFADSFDHLLMFVGTVGAIANGISPPLMTLLFGNMINAFAGTKNSNEVVEVSKVIPHESLLLILLIHIGEIGEVVKELLGISEVVT